MGAIPVFADVDPVTFNIDPRSWMLPAQRQESADVEIVGIIGVGLFGQPANYQALMQYAEANNFLAY